MAPSKSIASERSLSNVTSAAASLGIVAPNASRFIAMMTLRVFCIPWGPLPEAYPGVAFCVLSGMRLGTGYHLNHGGASWHSHCYRF